MFLIMTTKSNCDEQQPKLPKMAACISQSILFLFLFLKNHRQHMTTINKGIRRINIKRYQTGAYVSFSAL